MRGKGGSSLLNAKVPDQIPERAEELRQRMAAGAKPMTIGRYTVVCDGATMASMVNATLGVATQLDRALGYEANAGGTTVLDDPLAMVGHAHIASPLVTVTANRSAPAQLATVRWDDEGVEPRPFTLVKDGRLVDFQTTREQAAWLSPYYHDRGIPVYNRMAALARRMHMSLRCSRCPTWHWSRVRQRFGWTTLVADVRNGILVEGGQAWQVDFQARAADC